MTDPEPLTVRGFTTTIDLENEYALIKVGFPNRWIVNTLLDGMRDRISYDVTLTPIIKKKRVSE